MTVRIISMQRLCKECSETFPKDGKRQFCSDDCRRVYQNRVRSLSRAEMLGVDPIGSNITCRDCGALFVKEGSTQRICKECASTASRRRKTTILLASGSAPVGSTLQCQDCNGAFVKRASKVKRCLPCQAQADIERVRRYRERHPEKVRQTTRASDAKKRADPSWRERKREYTRKRCAVVRKTPKGGLDHRMSTAVRLALGSAAKRKQRWEDLVGYSAGELKAHIERQFLKGMSWDNMNLWHLDHIVPKASFKYSCSQDEEFKACWALANLRPLWAKENLSKSDARTHLI